MPSSYTASLRFTLQASGENLNTWGSILNAGAFSLVDTAISGIASIALAGNLTLSVANGATDQARSAILSLTGVGATITVPNVSKTYVVLNNTSGGVVFTTGAGNTCTLAAGTTSVIACDGTNCVKVTSDANDLANTLAAAKAYTDAAAFASTSGTLPGQAGNSGNFLTTNGTSPSWAAVPGLAGANTWSGVQTFAGGLLGVLTGSLIGNATTATSAGTATTATTANTANTATTALGLPAGTLTAAMMAPGAAQANFSYTPANVAGDTFTGNVTAPQFNGSLNGNATTSTVATGGASGFQVNGLTAVRVANGSAANSGRISWGTGAPGTLAVGEIYLQVAAA